MARQDSIEFLEVLTHVRLKRDQKNTVTSLFLARIPGRVHQERE